MRLDLILNELSEFYNGVELDLFTHELVSRGYHELHAYDWLRDMTIRDYNNNQEPDIIHYIEEYLRIMKH